MADRSQPFDPPIPAGPIAAQLVESGRLPAAVLRPATFGLPPGSSADGLQDRFQGCLLGVAIGDALGRAGEGRSPDATVRRFGGPLRSYQPWFGWTSGPTGTITDDTQMTLCIAESIIATGGAEPADIGRRFVKWLDYGRGKGRACVEACLRLQAWISWHESGVDSAGNGAAMRTAPIGLLRAHDLPRLRLDAGLACLITHAHPTAIASAIAQSAGIAYCRTQKARL